MDPGPPARWPLAQPCIAGRCPWRGGARSLLWRACGRLPGVRAIGGCPPRGRLLASPAPPIAGSAWLGGTRAMHPGALPRSGCHVGPRLPGTPPARTPPGRRSGGLPPVAASRSQSGTVVGASPCAPRRHALRGGVRTPCPQQPQAWTRRRAAQRGPARAPGRDVASPFLVGFAAGVWG